MKRQGASAAFLPHFLATMKVEKGQSMVSAVRYHLSTSLRLTVGLTACVIASGLTFAPSARAQTYPSLDAKIAHYAAIHGVPARLVHRVVHRESKGNPHLVHHGNIGLMQIKYGTARSMGYSGAPQGLLDAETNLAYAVPYLANAYRLAGGDEDRAVGLYAAGYYYTAKSHHMLADLRTADSPPVVSPLVASHRVGPLNVADARDMSRELELARTNYLENRQTAAPLARSVSDAAGSPLPPSRSASVGESARGDRAPAEYQVASLDSGRSIAVFSDRAPEVAPLPPPRPFSAY